MSTAKNDFVFAPWPLLRVAMGQDRPGDWEFVDQLAAKGDSEFERVVNLLVEADAELGGFGTSKAEWVSLLHGKTPAIRRTRSRAKPPAG